MTTVAVPIEKEAKTAQDFDLYIVEARNRFVDKINQHEWRTELRTEAENLLVAYDQMREKISAMEAFHQSKMVEEKVSEEDHLSSLIESLEKLRENNLLEIFKQSNAAAIKKLNKILFSEDGVFVTYEFLEWIVIDDDLIIMTTTDDRKWIWFSSRDERINSITTEQLYEIYKRDRIFNK